MVLAHNDHRVFFVLKDPFRGLFCNSHTFWEDYFCITISYPLGLALGAA